ncbi:MAG: hypothetical protein LBM69_03845 [Lachnospiraceae bacterium]|jgi:aryl-alcohol dehydrogenase-like predicted oxidoreductase|nr:hypothetical protein [Lachnospiraceae bacterium]
MFAVNTLRYYDHPPGISVTLTGTGNPAHLSDNLRAIQVPPFTGRRLETIT